MRAWSPPAREPSTSWLGRRSTTTTSMPANASSAANISPVGPPPATTTACSVMHLSWLDGAGRDRHSGRAMVSTNQSFAASPLPRAMLDTAGRVP